MQAHINDTATVFIVISSVVDKSEA